MKSWSRFISKGTWITRSSHRKCSVKVDLLRNFANFTGKPLYWSLFLQLQAFRRAILLKRSSSKGVFLVKFAKFLRTPVLRNICQRLPLNHEEETCSQYTLPRIKLVKKEEKYSDRFELNNIVFTVGKSIHIFYSEIYACVVIFLSSFYLHQISNPIFLR